MGDRTSTCFDIGGDIPTELVDELAEVIELQGFGLDYGEASEAAKIAAAIREADGEEALSIFDDQCNYASADELEAWLKEHKMPYRKSWDAGGGYGAGVAVYDGQEEREYSAEDGEAMLSHDAFKTLPTREAVAAWFEAAQFRPPVISLTAA